MSDDSDRIVIVIDGVRMEIEVPAAAKEVTVQVDQGRNADAYMHVSRDTKKPRGERKPWRQWGYGNESKQLHTGENNFTPDVPSPSVRG